MSKALLLNQFEEWACRTLGDRPSFKFAKTDEGENSSCYAQVESHVGIARVTLWKSGSYAKEYLSECRNVSDLMKSGTIGACQNFDDLFGDMSLFVDGKLGV